MIRDSRGARIERISFSGSGTIVIKAGATNRVIYVHSMLIIPNADSVEITIQSNGIDISPTIPLVKAGNGFILPSNGDYAWFASGESENLVLSATGEVAGLIILTQE